MNLYQLLAGSSYAPRMSAPYPQQQFQVPGMSAPQPPQQFYGMGTGGPAQMQAFQPPQMSSPTPSMQGFTPPRMSLPTPPQAMGQFGQARGMQAAPGMWGRFASPEHNRAGWMGARAPWGLQP